MVLFRKYLAVLVVGIVIFSCSEAPSGTAPTDLGGDQTTSADVLPCGQQPDHDGDGIPNEIEGCDKDVDSDGDKIPDWQDKDSDGDSLLDGDEDVNGDGLVGCCLAKCNTPGSVQQKACKLVTSSPARPTDGCGAGQQCIKGACVPAVNFKCAKGETSPTKKDTFGDGRLDNERGTFICRDATKDNPYGRKPVLTKQSPVAQGDWHVALEQTAKYVELKITGAQPKMAAAAIDLVKPDQEVAGFMLSLDCTKEKIQDVLTGLISSLQTKVPGGGGTVTPRASGTQGKSHDRYDTVQGTILDLKLSAASNVSVVRNELLATMLGKQISSLANLPQPFGSSASDFVVKFSTVKRVTFKKDSKGKLVKDSKGYPFDSGDKTKWRTIIIGAVASKVNEMNPKRPTGYMVDDLSNGTAVALASDQVGDECDVDTIIQLPTADIIWIVSESGLPASIWQFLHSSASNFFSRALSSGLDFRMGVTSVCDPGGASKSVVGKFCSKISTNKNDMGGSDRFLLPSEQTIFSACINNPPGYESGSEYGLVNAMEAVKKHLPRATGVPDKIRPNATLVIIVATADIPGSIASSIGSSNNKVCTLPAATQTAVNTALAPYLNLFSGITDPEAVAKFHVVGGVCNNSCGAHVAHGYRELAQKLSGLWVDVCQQNLGDSMQNIIDMILGTASRVALDYVPISSSLAVTIDAKVINRSRVNGFDFRSSANSLVYTNIKYQKGSEVIAAYKQWKVQTGF